MNTDDGDLHTYRKHPKIKKGGFKMPNPNYKSYEELPLFLNAKVLSTVLGIAPSSCYELMHEDDFPSIRIGKRLVVPRDKFIDWVEAQSKGGSK
jgi:predicted DNA-binding transcriptional regulator AlpA